MVKRYVTTCDCMSQAAWGDYVRYDDYATLEAENAKLRAELEFLRLNQRAFIGTLLSSFPLLNDDGLDETEHHCEWHIQQERKRLHTITEAARITMLAAAPSAPKADERPLYTCIGKGGEYRYLGTAIGAGDSRGELAEVYQDHTGQLFHRTPEDFMERMEPIAAARQEGGKV